MFMRTALVGAFAALAVAQSSVLSFTSVPNPVTDGQEQAITYQTNDTVTPVTITLRQGDPTRLQTLYNLTTTAIGGSYIWTPRTDLPNGVDYTLQITQGSQINYYGPFRVQGYTGASSTSSLASSAVTSSGSSSITPPPYGSAANNTASIGTGSAIPRNTTFISATLTNSLTSSATKSSEPTSSSATMTMLIPTASGAAASLQQIGGLMLAGAVAAVLNV